MKEQYLLWALKDGQDQKCGDTKDPSNSNILYLYDSKLK